MTVINLHVPGKPQPQGSKRHVGNGIMVEAAEQLGPWRERVALTASRAMRGKPLMAGAVRVEFTFVLYRPKTTPKTRTPQAIKKPDLDKLCRAACDALTGIVFADDSQVITMIAFKHIAALGESPGFHARIEEREP